MSQLGPQSGCSSTQRVGSKAVGPRVPSLCLGFTVALVSSSLPEPLLVYVLGVPRPWHVLGVGDQAQPANALGQ